MIPYFALLTVPAVLALSPRPVNNRLLLLVVFLVFVFFSGFRYRVGMDWNNYDYIHLMVGNLTFSEAITQSEPLSRALFWLSAQLDSHMLVTNIVAAALLALGIFTLAQRAANPWLAVVAATPYLFIAFGMPAVRQAMAIGVVFFALSRWHKDGLVVRTALLLIAALFHTSAVLAFVLIFAELRTGRRLQGALAILLSAAIGYLVFFSDFFAERLEFYESTYLGEESIMSPGALMHMALVWLPAAVYLVFRRSLSRYIIDDSLALHGSVAAIALVPVYFVSSTGGSRAILYLFFIPMLVYPALAQALVRLSGTRVSNSRAPDNLKVNYLSRVRRNRLLRVRTHQQSVVGRHQLAPLSYQAERPTVPTLQAGNAATSDAPGRRHKMPASRPYPRRTELDVPEREKSAGNAAVLALVLFHFLILATWLTYANNSSAHLPYRNIVFEDGL